MLILFLFLHASQVWAFSFENAINSEFQVNTQLKLVKLFDFYFKDLTDINYHQFTSHEDFHVQITKLAQQNFAIYLSNPQPPGYSDSKQDSTKCDPESHGIIPSNDLNFTLINDEPEEGFVVTADLDVLTSLYSEEVGHRIFRNPRGNYLTIVKSGCQQPFAEIETFMDFLWTEYRILDAMFVVFDPLQNFTVGLYDPFVRKAYWQNLDDMDMTPVYWAKRKFHQWTMRCSVFKRNPTMIELGQLSKIYTNSYMQDESQFSKGYIGVDGLVLANLAKNLNLSIDLKPVDSTQYGYQKADGKFTGSIHDLMNNISDISVNSRFVKFYNTTSIEFLEQIGWDAFCVVVPKAQAIPQWIAVFRCFDLTVWIVYLLLNIICAYVWVFFKLATQQYDAVSEQVLENNHHNRVQIFIEMLRTALGSPTTLLPKRNVERIFMAGYLISNIVVLGTFQGFLATAYSTTTYYKDIDTLQELDRSGLPIGTTSRDLINIFSDDDSELFRSLKAKTKLILHSTEDDTMWLTAFRRNICSIERKMDVPVLISTNYQLSDGTDLIHTMNECPRYHYLGYVVPKGSPFLPQLNNLIRRYAEAGLINKWYQDTVRAITNRYSYHAKPNKQNETRPFKLLELQIAFIIYFVGVFVSLTVFVGEILLSRYWVC